MIRFRMESKFSIKLEFDSNGAEELLKAFNNVLIEARGKTIVLEDNIYQKREQQTEVFISITDKNNKIYRENDLFVLELDRESVDYGIHKFNECLSGDDFYPAEFCEVKMGQNDVTIYGFYIKAN